MRARPPPLREDARCATRSGPRGPVAHTPDGRPRGSDAAARGGASDQDAGIEDDGRGLGDLAPARSTACTKAGRPAPDREKAQGGAVAVPRPPSGGPGSASGRAEAAPEGRSARTAPSGAALALPWWSAAADQRSTENSQRICGPGQLWDAAGAQPEAAGRAEGGVNCAESLSPEGAGRLPRGRQQVARGGAGARGRQLARRLTVEYATSLLTYQSYRWDHPFCLGR